MAKNRISPFEKHEGSEEMLAELLAEGASQLIAAVALQNEFDDASFTKSSVAKRIKKLGVRQTNTTVSEETMLEHLTAMGYQLVREPVVENKVFTVDTDRFHGDVVKFGVVSDTHLGSKYQQLTFLNQAYDYFAEEGITDVLHAGDLCAGNGRIYRGQIYEMFVHGADEMLDYATKHYPKRDGITTHVIAGNHDLSFLSSDGTDILKALANRRPDMNYLGHYSATVQFGSLKVGLHHGEGGCSYARSYKLQKLVEQLAPENKPHAFFLGHYHVAAGLEMYRNVFCRMMPCFEAQTPYLVRKGLYPELGFYVVKALMNPVDREDGVTNFRADFYPFFIPVKMDY
jgi:predicted phosphodiesterase